jgi:DNA invertase Pin-like site-specific DNA recombinase
LNLKNYVAEHNVLNIVGYIRKSRQDLEREKRTGEDTLAEQTTLMTRTLDSIELPYDLQFEIGSGDSIAGRPVFQEVIKDIEAKKYQAVAVKELSRLSRGSMTDAGRIIELLTDHRLIIITPYKVYDPRNPMDMKQIRFELFLAREEYEMIKERMVGARYIYASQGKWVAGKSPYGYDYDKKSQKLKINEEEAKTVRMIYDMFLNGLNGSEMSYTAVATYMTKLGIRTAKNKNNWAYSQIKNILTNDLYKGVIKFRTHERNRDGQRIIRPDHEHIYVEDAHEPIIDKETWEKVQLKIKNKITPHFNPLDFTPNELAGVCTCGNCGRKLIRNAQRRIYKKQDGTESEYYQEFLKCPVPGCMNVKYRDVEEAIIDHFKTLDGFSNKDFQKYLESMYKNINKDSDSETKNQMLLQIEQKEKELNERLNFIFEKYEKQIYSDDVFIMRKKTIDDEKLKLKDAKEEILNSTTSTKNIAVKEIKADIKNLLAGYSYLKRKEDKNELLRNLLIRVPVKIIEKGSGTRSSRFRIMPVLKIKMKSNVETLAK